MSGLKKLDTKIGKKHRQILEKFLVYGGQTITDSRLIRGIKGKSEIPPDKIVHYPHYMHGLNRGAFKLKGDPYTLSIRSNPNTKWGYETTFDENGKWLQTDYNFRGIVKKYQNEIEGLRQCFKEKIPVGVIFSPKKATNIILGLGIIKKIVNTSFIVVPFMDFSKKENEKLVDDYVEEKFAKGDYSSLGSEQTYVGRKQQSKFRKILVIKYRGKCLFCGFKREPYLIGAHIVPVTIMRKEDDKNAMHPENGLLLCKLCDVAYEQGEILLDENFQIIVTKNLAQHSTRDPSVKSWLGRLYKYLQKQDLANLKPSKKYLKRKLILVNKN